MVKVLSLGFQQCFSPSIMLLGKGSYETDSLDIYVTTFNGVRKFKNRSAMRVILFFEKYSKWNLNYVNAKKKLRKHFSYLI